MYLTDRLTLDAPRRCQDGTLVASVRAARTGIQHYRGFEVGRPELATVAVYRPEAEVFSRNSLATYASAPVTLGHPGTPVDTTNWRDHAIGHVGEEIVRDGEAVRVPIMVRDAAAIAAIDSGKREISMGYACDLSFEDGAAPDGTPYQAVQRNIRINHLAIVDAARGGPSLRIGDSDMNTKTIIVDGLQVVVTDAAEAAILKLQGQLSDAQGKVGGLTADLAKANTAIQAKDGEIAALNAKLKDAEVTPEKLQAMADARAKVIEAAKKIAPSLVADGKTEAAIRREAVSVRLGDAAKDMADAAIEGAFMAFAKDAAGQAVSDPLRAAIAAGPANVVDGRAAVATIRAARYAN